jgi:hypothetical protein
MVEKRNGLTKNTDRSDNYRADLHLHTTYSDGARSPKEIVQRAHAAGLSVISITDHDNVGALDEAIEVGKSLGIEVVAGVELSVALNEKDIHLLAYFFDHTNQKLLDYLSFFRYERLKRAERIVQKLNDINIPLKLDAVLDQAGIGSVGRPHIASALMEEGLTDTYHEAFLRYIGAGAPAYEKKYQLSPLEATQLITQSGGLSFLAHPGKYTTDVELSTRSKWFIHHITKRVRNFIAALFISISFWSAAAPITMAARRMTRVLLVSILYRWMLSKTCATVFFLELL